jgi:hypothetical protein
MAPASGCGGEDGAPRASAASTAASRRLLFPPFPRMSDRGIGRRPSCPPLDNHTALGVERVSAPGTGRVSKASTFVTQEVFWHVTTRSRLRDVVQEVVVGRQMTSTESGSCFAS